MDWAQKQKVISGIKQHVGEQIDFGTNSSDDEIKELIEKAVFDKSGKGYISIKDKVEIIQAVFNSLRRFDILQPIIDDALVTEIMVNGPNVIFVEREGKVKRLDISFESREKLEDLIQSIVSKVNRIVNEASPIVDARLQDGSRVNVILYTS